MDLRWERLDTRFMALDYIRIMLRPRRGFCCLVVRFVVSRRASFGPLRRPSLLDTLVLRIVLFILVRPDTPMCEIRETDFSAIWQSAKAAGPIVGGAINLGLNAQSSSKGSVSSATYIVFIVIMCLGLPIALLLSPAEKVQRKDKTLVIVTKQPTWAAEFKAVLSLLATKRMLLLIPAFFISYFYNGFMSTWLTTYFTVRSRAFSSFFTNFSGIISSFLIAGLLDRQSIYIKTRARIAFLSIITILTGTWIWATILQKQFYDAAEPPVFDWFKGGFGKSYALIFFWQFGGQAFQQFLYWLVGQYTTDISSLSYHCGILRGFEALGQTVAWA